MLLLSSNLAHARDSAWLLCNNKNYALNILEHRAGDGSSRLTEFLLIHGMHYLQGQIDSDDEVGMKNIRLVSKEEAGTVYQGSLKVNYQTRKVKVNGKLYFEGSSIPEEINGTFNCQEMN